MSTVDLLQKKWDHLKDQIDRLNQYPPDERLRKRIRTLKNEASTIRFAIEDIKAGHPRDVVLDNLKSNRAFYLKVTRHNEQ